MVQDLSFGFRVLPAIIFVTALVSILYYIGVMGILIRILGGIFQKALNISKIESFVAVTTIFLGQNEIPAIVVPFIDRLNRNDWHLQRFVVAWPRLLVR